MSIKNNTFRLDEDMIMTFLSVILPEGTTYEIDKRISTIEIRCKFRESGNTIYFYKYERPNYLYSQIARTNFIFDFENLGEIYMHVNNEYGPVGIQGRLINGKKVLQDKGNSFIQEYQEYLEPMKKKPFFRYIRKHFYSEID